MNAEVIQQVMVWLKDISTVLFSCTVAVVAILTYRRAKETILQPVRSEVIKRQTQEIEDLLELVSRNPVCGDLSFDYLGIVNVNIWYALTDLGFISKDHLDIERSMKEKTGGLVTLGEVDFPAGVQGGEGFFRLSEEVIQEQERANRERMMRQYDLAKKGSFSLETLHLTNSHVKYSSDLGRHAVSPYLPEEICGLVRKILADVHSNIRISLRQTIEEFALDYCREGSPKDYDVLGVYNHFNHLRIQHEEDFANLRDAIRKRLKVDTMP